MEIAFASDNYAGVHPSVLGAIARANSGPAIPYGEDPWTARLGDVVSETLGTHATVLPVFNGTGANIVCLRAIAPAWGSVVVPATSHELTDESGAAEHALGLKLLAVPTRDGKLRPSDVEEQLAALGNVHSAQPCAISVANLTEVGTAYTPDEIGELARIAHAHGLLMHVDGTRLWAAAVATGSSLRSLVAEAGVDIASIGGTKAGALAAECVVALNPHLGGLPYIRKQLAQLASKSRYLSAQMLALFDDDLGMRLARHAHEMMRRLLRGIGSDGRAGARGTPKFAFDVQGSAAFPVLADEAARRLRASYRFYDWRVLPGAREVRWMTSWATTPAQVDAFARAIRAAIGPVTGPYHGKTSVRRGVQP